MASEALNEVRLNLIENVRPRLRRLIQVEPVLDLMHSIDSDQKEVIRKQARAEGDINAANSLIDIVIQIGRGTPRGPPGWFREFVDALYSGGSQYAANYVEAILPSPKVEADNDYCVRLIELLSRNLLDMKTTDVCLGCCSEDILTQEDSEIIQAETANNGNMKGARELLRRIVRCRPGWFSKFLQVLHDTDHLLLYKELTGVSPSSDIQGETDGSSPLTEEGELQLASSDAATEGGEGCSILQEESLDNDTTEDLYNEECVETRKLVNGLDLSEPEETSTAAMAGSPQNAGIVLRDYQLDVARPALEGKNIIVCLPTGSGKTRVAVYITEKHLDARRREGRPGKVVVLVNKVPLVDQHYSTEFWPFLKHSYKVERVSGDSQRKISFTEIVKQNDVIICTAQILENFLERANSGEDEGLRLSDLTLLVIDECHHTTKGEVYNHIMMRYLKQKHKNSRLKKEQKEPVPIPQILGLTASPGVGGATKLQKAQEHILRICANLDACKIMTWTNAENAKKPFKKISTVEERKQDPFGDVIKRMMNAIHTHAELQPTCDLGSQMYEQWVVQKEQNAAKEEDQKVRVCADHLRHYNEGLLLRNTIRMCDAVSFLNKYQEEEMKRKVAPVIHITDTETFLFNLFKENKEELQELAKIPANENKSLSDLRSRILHEFTSREKARGIIFTKTRRSAIALSQWVQENPKFEEVEVKARYVIGGGDQSVVKPMTSAEQKDVLNQFGNGEINLLIATTVAEEGLDIPQCNFVIRYGLVTNEIAMIQAQGRARAEDSSYTVVEVEGSGVAEKECVNEYREKMMLKAIDKIKNLNQIEYDKQIMTFQIQAIMEKTLRAQTKTKKQMKKESPSKVAFSCRGCNKHVCTGEDIQIIENMHHVNVTPQFLELFIQRENTTLQERCLDYETNGFIACKDCGQRWGSMALYRGLECPSLHVKNFVVTLNGKKNSKCTKWSELAIQLPAFDYIAHAGQMVQSSEDEATE